MRVCLLHIRLIWVFCYFMYTYACGTVEERRGEYNAGKIPTGEHCK